MPGDHAVAINAAPLVVGDTISVINAASDLTAV
jgi:hypothetical protein